MEFCNHKKFQTEFATDQKLTDNWQDDNGQYRRQKYLRSQDHAPNIAKALIYQYLQPHKTLLADCLAAPQAQF